MAGMGAMVGTDGTAAEGYEYRDQDSRRERFEPSAGNRWDDRGGRERDDERRDGRHSDSRERDDRRGDSRDRDHDSRDRGPAHHSHSHSHRHGRSARSSSPAHDGDTSHADTAHRSKRPRSEDDDRLRAAVGPLLEAFKTGSVAGGRVTFTPPGSFAIATNESLQSTGEGEGEGREASDGAGVLVFPATLNSWQRRAVHREAEGRGLWSVSEGEGRERALRVGRCDKPSAGAAALAKQKQEQEQE